MNTKDIFLALLVVLIWGVNFSFIKVGLQELPPILFSALRFAVVALPAVLFIPFPKTSKWNVIGVGMFLGVFKFGLLFIAMKSDASAGLSSLILQAQVFFTIVLSVLFLREHITKVQIAGIGIAVIGFSFYMFNAGGNITVLGLMLILSAAFFWAIANVMMKRMQGVNLFHFIIWVSLIPPLPLLALSLFMETSNPVEVLLSTSMKTWGALAYVSYISTLLAFALWGALLKNYSAASVTPFALLIPVVGMLTSNIMLNESLETSEIVGALMIMSGLVVCVLGKRLLALLVAPSSQKTLG
ncbi:EamA family transporter [Pseudoalteromonas xiamenensis]|uniref:EamA family transporter n=2 Tax=Pseudoalteromonas xiamenensis TaxID=882626 RepID=UPI0027E420B8|nr:EamA family transporter [Pseudoalteromonas xiamenensis]WMN60842.1 EamA family transporter [Pseudoalteromonas xiamenensis]